MLIAGLERGVGWLAALEYEWCRCEEKREEEGKKFMCAVGTYGQRQGFRLLFENAVSSGRGHDWR